MLRNPEKFGQRYRDRLVFATFVTGTDYVQASRMRRELTAEMLGLLSQVDVVLTAGSPDEAPLIENVSRWENVEKPNFTMAFNLTGLPAVCVPSGFGPNGMPVSIQLAAKPFAEGTLLRAAHAYEKATPWRTRRPQLDPDAEFSTVLSLVPDPEPAQIDPATRERVAINCRAAGLTLSDRQFDMACAAAPYVIAMTGRLYRNRAYSEEPANIFRFG